MISSPSAVTTRTITLIVPLTSACRVGEVIVISAPNAVRAMSAVRATRQAAFSALPLPLDIGQISSHLFGMECGKPSAAWHHQAAGVGPASCGGGGEISR